MFATKNEAISAITELTQALKSDPQAHFPKLPWLNAAAYSYSRVNDHYSVGGLVYIDGKLAEIQCTIVGKGRPTVNIRGVGRKNKVHKG